MNEQTKLELLKIAVELTAATSDKEASQSKDNINNFNVCFDAVLKKYEQLSSEPNNQ